MPYILALQGSLIVFSLAGVLVKVAADTWAGIGFWSLETISALAGSVFLMLVYAFFWQKIIKHMPLTLAYLNRGTIVFWGLIWAVILFGESITFFNLLGSAIIFAGLVLVNKP